MHGLGFGPRIRYRTQWDASGRTGHAEERAEEAFGCGIGLRKSAQTCIHTSTRAHVGVSEIRGYLIGVLSMEGILLFGVFLMGPLFRKTPTWEKDLGLPNAA